MHQNNVFTVAKRTLEGQDMVYQAIKFTNNVWALCELKLSPGNNVISVRNIKKNMIFFFKFLINFFDISVGSQISSRGCSTGSLCIL